MIGRFRSPNKAEPPEEKPRSFDDFDLRLGDLMRGERATLGKSLLDVQRELKIKAAYIAAIENADPTAFETQGFVAGYVRSYARYLDMDPEWAYRKFCEEGKFTVPHGMSAAATINRGPRSLPEGPRDIFANPATPFAPRGQAAFARVEPGALGSLAVLVALIAGLGYGGWSVLQEIQKVQFAPVEQSPGLIAEISDMETPGAVADAAVGRMEIAAPSPDALDRLYRPQALDVPVLVARDGPISSLDPGKRAQPGSDVSIDLAATQDMIEAAVNEALVAEAAAAPPADPARPRVFGPDAPDVAVIAVREAWVRVSAADGAILLEKTLKPGETYILPKTERPPKLRAGNAGSVYFAVNGETYGPAGNSGAVVSNVALAPTELKERYKLADLTRDRALADFIAVAQNQARGN